MLLGTHSNASASSCGRFEWLSQRPKHRLERSASVDGFVHCISWIGVFMGQDNRNSTNECGTSKSAGSLQRTSATLYVYKSAGMCDWIWTSIIYCFSKRIFKNCSI